jgi:hypothetical protein
MNETTQLYTWGLAVTFLLLSEYLLLVPPAWRILKRAGFRPAWSLVAVIPPVGLWLLLGLLAFVEWPGLRRTRSS